MNLTNEQRAHDLALLSVQAEINRKLLSQLNKAEYSEDEKKLDIYVMYYDEYYRALEAFNLDFTNK